MAVSSMADVLWHETLCSICTHIYHTAYNHATQCHAEKNVILMGVFKCYQ